MPEVTYTEAEITRRFADLFHIMDCFCAAYNRQSDVKAEIDASALYLVVVAMYDDIARYKAYRLVDPETQRANAIKRAAYASKWLMHFSPIMFPDVGHDRNARNIKHDCLVNALFSIHFCLVNIEVFTGRRILLEDEINYNLIYDLMYRNVGGDNMILTLDIIVKLASGQDAIKVLN